MIFRPVNSWGSFTRFLTVPRMRSDAFEHVLALEPRRELVLRSSARVLARLNQPDLARSTLKKTISVNPWQSSYHLELAKVCIRLENWPEAITASRTAIRLNPELFEARSLLVHCYLRSGEPAKADAEFQVLIKFHPASRDVWQQWYEQQKRVRAGGVGSIPTRRP